MLQAIPNGLVDATSIVSLVLMYGGAFGIINSTRVIECGIASSIEKMRRFSVLILPVIMILFSLMGAMLGISESCYAFIPLCIMLAKAMDYDAIVGFAIVMLANMIGFTAGPMNMYTTEAGLPSAVMVSPAPMVMDKSPSRSPSCLCSPALVCGSQSTSS